MNFVDTPRRFARRAWLRAVAVGLLVLAFIGLSTWWVFHFPDDPAGMARCLPANTSLVVELDAQPADRWLALLTSATFEPLLGCLGIGAKDLQGLHNPTTVQFIRRLAGRRVLAGYVPEMPGQAGPSWVFVGCPGWYAQVLRFYLTCGWVPDFARTVDAGGVRCWRLKSKPGRQTGRLSAALTEGLLLGCYAADATGVRHLAEELEKRPAPPLRPVPAAPAGPFALAPDRGRVHWPGLPVAWNGFLTLSPVGTNGLAGRLRWPYGMPLPTVRTPVYPGGIYDVPRLLPGAALPASAAASAAGRRSRDCGGLEHLVGDAADAMAILPVSLLRTALADGSAPDGLKLACQALRDVAGEDGDLCLGLLSEEYSGRILGVKTPTVIVGVRAADPAAAPAAVGRLLDQLNARYGLALIPRREVVGPDPSRVTASGNVPLESRTLTVVDSSRSDLYAGLAAREKAAVAMDGDWLVFCSSMDVLDRLMNRTARETGRWSVALRPYDDVAGVWVDLAGAGLSLRKAMAVYSLVLMARNAEGSAETRRRVEAAKGWIEALRPLERCVIRATSTAESFDISFCLGPP